MIDFTNANEMLDWIALVNAPVSCLYKGSRVEGGPEYPGWTLKFIDALRRVN